MSMEMVTTAAETTVKEQLERIYKELSEMDILLAKTISGIIGQERPEEVEKEPQCLQDDLTRIERLADRCLGMSNRIQQLLF